MNKVTPYLLLGLLLIAALTRFVALDNKPIHFDESINGWFVLQMRHLGYYRYDPQNYHGPLYFYLLEIWTSLFGHSLGVIRILPSLFSFAALWFFFYRSFWVAFFLLLSPSMIFFGRSGIHESAFVLAQMFFFFGLYQYSLSQRLLSLWLALLGLCGMMTLKETFVFTGFAFLVAAHWRFPWRSFFQDLMTNLRGPLIFFMLATVLLFTGFGRNPQGLVDLFRAFTFWFKTGVASGHNKSFFYWFELASQTEPLVLVGFFFSLCGVFISRFRMLSLFALTTGFIYSAVPYKTPWCFISLAWPFYLVLGEMLSAWISRIKGQKKRSAWPEKIGYGGLAVGFLASTLFQVHTAWTAVYQNPINLDHPFVYVNSSYTFKKIDDALQKVLKERPELRQQVIQISLDEMWPMPWTLQDGNLHYDRLKNLRFPQALAYFCEVNEGSELDKAIDKENLKGYVNKTLVIRQYGRMIKIYLRADIFPEFPQ